jgi:error-prone DNA polymerase
MGFYGPSQLVQDARRHGVEVRPVDVTVSDWDCSLEIDKNNEPVLRLGLRMIKGLSHAGAERLVEARRIQEFENVEDMTHRAHLNRLDLEVLAAADALRSLAGHRHRARWDVLAVESGTPLFGETQINEATPLLRMPREGEEIIADYESLSLTLRRHPLALIREQLTKRQVITAAEIANTPHGSDIYTAGLVIGRQRPGSAAGVVFVTLEDETGQINLVVWKSILERQRRELLDSRLLGVFGEVQREGEVIHVIAKQLQDYSELLGELKTASRDFH